MELYFDPDPLQVVDAPALPEDGGGESVDPATDYIAINAIADAQPSPQRLASPEVFIEGTNASETLQGERGKTNSISGFDGDDVLLGRGRLDLLYGGNGNDRLEGGSSLDFLYGDTGQDTLNGGGGGDYLQGDRGRDLLTGGSGGDQFATQENTGRDTITDYLDGVDKLATFIPFSDLTISQRGLDTVIRSGSNTVLGSAIAILKNVSASTITADDFVVPLNAIV
jgi:Ca2+-binding RTX toxin-like protein